MTSWNLSLPYDTSFINATTVALASTASGNTYDAYPNSLYTPNAATALKSYDFSTRNVANLSDTTVTFFVKLNNIRYSFSSTNRGFGIA